MENTKNKIGVAILIIILLVFSVGGYFFMNYMVNEGGNTKKSKKEVADLRIDESKDYIYFENTEEIIEEIFKEDVILNFKGLESINESLASELKTLDNNKVKVTNEEIPEGVVCYEDLYSFKYRDYTNNQFGKFVSLVVRDYDYSCINGSIPINTKSYVVDKNTGKLITEDELLKEFNIGEDKILEQVRERLNFTQTLDEDVQVIDIDGTINSLKEGQYGTNKALSISKNGKLMINFIVKSNKINYNDSIELD